MLLHGGIQIYIDDVLYSSKSQRNLLSFKDICRNEYHIKTTNEKNVEYLLKNAYKKKYFSYLVMQEVNVGTIAGSIKLIEGSGRATFLLHGGTQIYIDDALYYSESQRNLLSFKDIRRNGYHVETTNEENIEYLYITRKISNKKCILEKLSMLSFGLYYTYISAIEAHIIVNQKFTNKNMFIVWHDRLGHPGSIMMRKIIENSCGHSLKNQKIQSNELSCATCSQEKFIIRPSPAKIQNESLTFLEHIQCDICGTLYPPCELF